MALEIEEYPITTGHEIVKFEPKANADGGLKHWTSYIQDMLVCGHINNACIYELKSGTLLASSQEAFSLSESEFLSLVKGIHLPNLLRENGLHVAGKVYEFHTGDGKFGAMGKSGLPAEGCTVCKTRTLLLVATHNGKMKARVCNETVMLLGDFLLAKGI